MPAIERWQLWYDDGRTAAGATYQQWCAAPADGVALGMWFFADGTAAIVSGQDLYWVHDFGGGLIYAHDNDRDGLLRRLPFIKFGRWVTHERYAALQDEALVAAGKWAEEHQPAPDPETYKGCCG